MRNYLPTLWLGDDIMDIISYSIAQKAYNLANLIHDRMINVDINLIKSNFKFNALLKSSKYALHNMLIDDLQDLTGIAISDYIWPTVMSTTSGSVGPYLQPNTIYRYEIVGVSKYGKMATILYNDINVSSYNKIIYVDGTNGSDTTGNGSLSQPYQTVTKAFANTVNNSLVYIIREGIYNIPNGLQSILKNNMAITYSVPQFLRGSVVFNLGNTGQNNSILMSYLNRFIGIVFRRYSGGDSRIYEYFYDGAKINLQFDNCVFDSGAITPFFYLIFTGNSRGCTITKLDYINCSFIPNFSSNDDGNNIRRGNFINCAHKKTDFTADPYNLTGVVFDTMYNITSSGWRNIGIGTNPDGSPANIGVYGGQCAWVTSIKTSSTVYPIQLSWSAVDGAISYRIYRDSYLLAETSTTSYVDDGNVNIDTNIKKPTLSISNGYLYNADNESNLTVTTVGDVVTCTNLLFVAEYEGLIEFYVTPDDGNTWIPIQSEQLVDFSTSTVIRFKFVLHNTAKLYAYGYSYR
jgi:hypothetical protein